MFWLRNKKINFWVRTLNLSPDFIIIVVSSSMENLNGLTRMLPLTIS